MASLPPSNDKLVLISGINGYIASSIGMQLLEKGYSIRGTARSAKSTQALVEGPYAQYAHASPSRVQILEVPDMTVDGAFDEAVKGGD